MFLWKGYKDEQKMRKKQTDRVRRKFYRMLRYLNRKGICNLNLLCLWQDDLANDDRFVLFPPLCKSVNRFWSKDIAPFVVEMAYVTLETLCYRNQMRNLLCMYFCEVDADFHNEERVWELTTLLYITLEMSRLDIGLHLSFDLDSEDATYYQRTWEIVKKLKGADWERYYKQIVEPIAVEILLYGAWSNLFGSNSAEGVMEALQWDEDLDKEVVQFLVEDAWDYVYGCDCSQYNPF